jgi:hypothetical protein
MTAVPATPRADPKPDLLDQLLVIERLIERNDLWRGSRADRNLGDLIEHEDRCLRQTAKALALLRAHEREFVALVQRSRRAGRSAT